MARAGICRGASGAGAGSTGLRGARCQKRIAAITGTPASAVHWSDASVWEGKSMRWKTGHGGHDPRHIDLIATFALLVLIVAACRFLTARSDAPSVTAFIVPS